MQNPLPSLACQLRPTSVAMPELFSMIFSQSSKDVTRPIKFDGEGGAEAVAHGASVSHRAAARGAKRC